MPPLRDKLSVLIVTLGQSINDVIAQIVPEMKAVIADGTIMVPTRHSVKIIADGWQFIADTRFSSVDSENDKVISVLLNPHAEYLTFQQAADLVDKLEIEFRRLQFYPRLDRLITGLQLRSAAPEIAKSTDYNRDVFRARRANVLCSLVLKKAILKDSPIGQLAGANSDLYLLTLTLKNLKEGDRF